jgi:hypothetical protein
MARPSSYVTKDFYKSYISSVKDNPLYYVKHSVFRAVFIDYINYILDRLFTKSEEVRLPGRMGYLQIMKRKPKSLQRKHLQVDFKATMELNKTILHFNEHSNGYNYRFHWRKDEMLVRHKTMYELIMTRTNKRRLASIIKNREFDYIEM